MINRRIDVHTAEKICAMGKATFTLAIIFLLRGFFF